MAKKTKKLSVDGAGFGGSMAELLAEQDFVGPTGLDSVITKLDSAKERGSMPLKGKWKAQVERKGRKGKTVTRLYGVDISASQQAELCRALGKALGCRAFLEEGEILVQGKHAERALLWLARYGQ